jgi:flavorubredoxin
MIDPTQKVAPRSIGGGVDVFTSYFAVPGLGLVPINAFLLHAEQPVLVDTGLVARSGEYFDAIGAAIDLRQLRWIWLTHDDPDHIGSLRDLLAAAPQARLVTTFVGLGKLSLYGPVAPHRVYLLNPGQSLDVGDRMLLCMKPPTYDAPETTCFFDSSTRTLFSSDCFGAVLAEPAERANDIAPGALRDGAVLWATLDSPWLESVVPSAFETALTRIRDLAPTRILSTHLPPALAMTDVLLGHERTARMSSPYVGPDQQAFTAMLSGQPPPRATDEARP